jgi:hypothetical protein
MSVSRVFLVPRSLTVTALVAALGGTLAACGDGADGPDEQTVEGCTTAGPLVAPATPTLAPPAGAELYLRLRADGTQIYTCTAAGGQWTLKAPQARLVDDGCHDVGSHFAGPSWKLATDGSAVVGRKAAEVAAPVAGAIPWLLIEAVSKTGSGMLDPVSYIQRVDTAGGMAPTGGCDAAGAGIEVAIPYTALSLLPLRDRDGRRALAILNNQARMTQGPHPSGPGSGTSLDRNGTAPGTVRAPVLSRRLVWVQVRSFSG